ncbi:hypothetical protein G6F50_014192 [Rhizopus delemar]|uniref:Uncharacterized protein n=1 Tax=Rhizopus delemar TaxID=936053 RepID=A0A9P6Y8E6_9FUNG|nr:hypothetical protein G6F50_014192 [Rhizopus delemar]
MWCAGRTGGWGVAGWACARARGAGCAGARSRARCPRRCCGGNHRAGIHHPAAGQRHPPRRSAGAQARRRPAAGPPRLERAAVAGTGQHERRLHHDGRGEGRDGGGQGGQHADRRAFADPGRRGAATAGTQCGAAAARAAVLPGTECWRRASGEVATVYPSAFSVGALPCCCVRSSCWPPCCRSLPSLPASPVTVPAATAQSPPNRAGSHWRGWWARNACTCSVTWTAARPRASLPAGSAAT